MRPQYAGRNRAASPATGLASRHKEQQEALVAEALGLADGKRGSAKKKG
jgi:2-oxoglutarate dehydrogenase E1 component